MAGTLNALGLLFVIGITIAALRRHGRVPRQFRSVLFGLLLAILSMFIASVFSTHMCKAGSPVMQLLIPAICFVICYAAVDTQYRWELPVLFLAPLVLGFHFSVLVHQEGYSGNPRGANRTIRFIQQDDTTQLKQYCEFVLKEKPALGDRRYPPGLLASSGAWQVLGGEVTDEKLRQHYLASKGIHTYRLWHTWLTGIYGARRYTAHAWYPGGKLKDAVPRLEYR